MMSSVEPIVDNQPGAVEVPPSSGPGQCVFQCDLCILSSASEAGLRRTALAPGRNETRSVNPIVRKQVHL